MAVGGGVGVTVGVIVAVGVCVGGEVGTGVLVADGSTAVAANPEFAAGNNVAGAAGILSVMTCADVIPGKAVADVDVGLIAMVVAGGRCPGVPTTTVGSVTAMLMGPVEVTGAVVAIALPAAAVGAIIGVSVGNGVFVGNGVAVAVKVGVGVLVGNGVFVAVFVGVGVFVAVAVLVGVGVLVGVWVGVAVGVAVAKAAFTSSVGISPIA